MLVRCSCALAILVAACLGASCKDKSPTSPSGSQPLATYLSFTSSPGDFIGQGGSRRFEPPATAFFGQMVSGNGRLELRMSIGTTEAWFLDITAPSGQRLTAGVHKCSIGITDRSVL